MIVQPTHLSSIDTTRITLKVSVIVWLAPSNEDRAGTIWIGYGNGSFDAYEKDAASFIRYPGHVNPDSNLPPFQIGAFLEDQEGYLWIASGGEV